MKLGTKIAMKEKVRRCLVEIQAGETGKIIDVDPDNGDVVISTRPLPSKSAGTWHLVSMPH